MGHTNINYFLQLNVLSILFMLINKIRSYKRYHRVGGSGVAGGAIVRPDFGRIWKKACSIIKPWIKTSPRVSEVPLPLISGSAGTYWILNSRWICLPLFKRIFNAARYNNSNNVQYQPGWLQCQLMFWYAEIEIKRNWIQLISHWRSMLYAAMSKSMLLWGKIKTISEFLGL